MQRARRCQHRFSNQVAGYNPLHHGFVVHMASHSWADGQQMAERDRTTCPGT